MQHLPRLLLYLSVLLYADPDQNAQNHKQDDYDADAGTHVGFLGAVGLYDVDIVLDFVLADFGGGRSDGRGGLGGVLVKRGRCQCGVECFAGPEN